MPLVNRDRDFPKESTFIKLAAGGALVISLLALFGFEDIFVYPVIEINPNYIDLETVTQVVVPISNNGNEHATNVRITFNSIADIKVTQLYSAEDTDFDRRGDKATVVLVPRLSPNETVEFLVDADMAVDEMNLAVIVTYDQGDRIEYNSIRDGKSMITSPQIIP